MKEVFKLHWRPKTGAMFVHGPNFKQYVSCAEEGRKLCDEMNKRHYAEQVMKNRFAIANSRLKVKTF